MDDNVVCIINSDEETELGRSDKPIIDLFNNLMKGAKHTLTDAQLVEILQNEFNIDVKTLHPLEKDIYLAVIKKFLKVWPEWGEFDIIVDNLKGKTKFEKKTICEEKYINLKIYLKTILYTAIPLAAQAVQRVSDTVHSNTILDTDESAEADVVLEIEASRPKLNKLFFRYPNTLHNNTIINISTEERPCPKIFRPALKSILNWWDIKIYVFTPFTESNLYFYKRETKHEFEHKLINKRLLSKTYGSEILDQELKVQMYKSDDKIKMDLLINLMRNICQYYSEAVKDVNELFDFILKDLLLLPAKILTMSNYKRYTNKYPYIRYLYQNVNNVSEDDYKKYDIQLQEIIKPAYIVSLGSLRNVNRIIEWSMPQTPIILECTSCSLSFKGSQVINELKAHFQSFHQNEVEFSCTNCFKNFEVETLSNNWWCHEC